MSDLVEQYAKEYASKQVLDAMASGVRSLMEKGGMALETAMELLSAPRVHGSRSEARPGGVSAPVIGAGGVDDGRVQCLTAGRPAGNCMAGRPAAVSHLNSYA